MQRGLAASVGRVGLRVAGFRVVMPALTALLALVQAAGCAGRGNPGGRDEGADGGVREGDLRSIERRAIAEARRKEADAARNPVADPQWPGLVRRRPSLVRADNTPGARPAGSTGASVAAPGIGSGVATAPFPQARTTQASTSQVATESPAPAAPASPASSATPPAGPANNGPAAAGTVPAGPADGAGSLPAPDPTAVDLTPRGVPPEYAVKDLDPAAPKFPGLVAVRMSLQDAVRRALANSHAIKAAAYRPAITATEILEAEGIFDPTVFLRGDGVSDASGFAGTLYRSRDQPLGSPLAGAVGGGGGGGGALAALVQREFGWRMGIQQLLPTGARVTISQRLSHTESNNPFLAPNPQSAGGITASISQPLLRGWGVDVNRGRIHIASNNKEVGIQEFRRRLIEQLRDVESAWWNVVLGRYTVSILERQLDQQKRTLDQIAIRRDVLPFSLARAKASLAATEAAVLQARVNLRDSQDRLKLLLNDPALPLRQEVEIIPLDEPALAVVPTDSEVREACLRAALENRPEILSARMEVRNAAIREGLTRNDLLPRLDVMAETLSQGIAGQVGTAFRDQWTFRFQDWVFGLAFEAPLGNRTARARHRRETLAREAAIESLSLTVQSAYFDVSTALRALENSQGQIPARQRSLDAAASELPARQARLGNRDDGPIPTQLDLLLQSQERLSAAAQSYWQARIELLINIARLEAAKGTLLYYDNVDIEEDAHRQGKPEWNFEPRDVVPGGR